MRNRKEERKEQERNKEREIEKGGGPKKAKRKKGKHKKMNNKMPFLRRKKNSFSPINSNERKANEKTKPKKRT